MGNCISFTPQEHSCGQCGQTPQTNPELKNASRWVDRDLCRKCFVAKTLEKEKFLKERAFYARAKNDLYPKKAVRPELQRIHSNEPWASGDSFFKSFSPSAAIKHLYHATSSFISGATTTVAPTSAKSGAPYNHEINPIEKHDLESTPEEGNGSSSSHEEEYNKLHAIERELEVEAVDEHEITQHGSTASQDALLELSNDISFLEGCEEGNGLGGLEEGEHYYAGTDFANNDKNRPKKSSKPDSWSLNDIQESSAAVNAPTLLGSGRSVAVGA